MTVLVLRGFAALQALTRSASALLDDAATLVRRTAPDSHERLNGITPGVSPRTGRPAGTGMRGILALSYAVARWPEWRTGILGVIDRESMRSTVREAVDPVLTAGDRLVNSTVRAARVFDDPWATDLDRLSSAVNVLASIRRHVPADPEPTPGKVMVSLAHRLIAQNRQLRDAVREAPLAGHGLHDAMTEEYREQTWQHELNQNSGHGRYWLDAVRPDDDSRLPLDDRVMATLFELSIAVIMLKKGPAADRVKEAHDAVLAQPYWNVVSSTEWLANGGKPEHNPFDCPWMPIEKPIARKLLDELLAACIDYAARTAEWKLDHQAPPPASDAQGASVGVQVPDAERSPPSRPVATPAGLQETIASSNSVRRCVFRKVGAMWEVWDGDLTGVYPDFIGMKYIHMLLGSPNPDKPVAATDLVGIDPARAPQNPPIDDIIDVRAKADYQDTIGRLEREIQEAKASKDERKEELLERERGDVIRELAAATGKGGRIRLVGTNTPAESARASVKLALNRAYVLLRKGKPPLDELADHLKMSIGTEGPAYAYRPVGQTPAWVLE